MYIYLLKISNVALQQISFDCSTGSVKRLPGRFGIDWFAAVHKEFAYRSRRSGEHRFSGCSIIRLLAERDKVPVFRHSVSESICDGIPTNAHNYKHYIIQLNSVDGGVSKNDFICQLLANLTGLHVERSVDSELSVLGAGFLAGLNAGFWSGRDELLRLRQIERTFVPGDGQTREAALAKQRGWERAVDRFRGWYGTSSSSPSSGDAVLASSAVTTTTTTKKAKR